MKNTNLNSNCANLLRLCIAPASNLSSVQLLQVAVKSLNCLQLNLVIQGSECCAKDKEKLLLQGISHTTQDEMAIAEAMEENETLLKLGLTFRKHEARNMVDMALYRNNEIRESACL